MTLRSIVLIIKQFRFELTVVVAVLLGVAALELLVVAALPGIAAAAIAEGCGYSERCQSLLLIGGILWSMASALGPVASVVGVIGAVLLGVALVGREVERGTATLAWPLVRSRCRWLAARVIVIGAILILAAAAPAMVADRLVPIVRPDLAAKSVFFMFETRGLLPIGRDLAAFAIAVFAGAAFGRVLPGLLLALVLAAVGYWAQFVANEEWRTSEAVVMSGDYSDENLVLDSRLRDASGQIVTWSEAYERDTSPDGSVPDGWPDSTYEQVTIGLPGARRPDIDRREAALFGVMALLAIGGSAVIVERRRPY